MNGKGNAGMNGGGPGDLLINIKEKEHDHFTRDGHNILYEFNYYLLQLFFKSFHIFSIF